MKLNYRGLSYTVRLASALLEKTWVIAQSRGLVYRLNRPVFAAQHSSKTLKYRGISYQATQSTPIRVESKPTVSHQPILTK